uniref:Uncharacterized protein n=1 Tax=Zea mays TaxID=4577 RepID=B6SQV3_MAIZE|nr:hypothetical protein [Zea mays]
MELSNWLLGRKVLSLFTATKEKVYSLIFGLVTSCG